MVADVLEDVAQRLIDYLPVEAYRQGTLDGLKVDELLTDILPFYLKAGIMSVFLDC